jgi:hypothetical protein
MEARSLVLDIGYSTDSKKKLINNRGTYRGSLRDSISGSRI